MQGIRSSLYETFNSLRPDGGGGGPPGAFAVPLALAALMLFIMPASYADDPPTAQQCRDAYMKSPAAPSCESSPSQTDVSVDSNGMCEISDTCPTHDGQPERSTVTVSVVDAEHVENCGGWLSLECPY